ncbi:MFS transporter [Candidatus Bandiella numerosa]|uniref:MFS transporter n=1 Tax=Candidatus Bandiella numerosa TaxID=2570586 RepID=UPI00249F0E09|nr:MFS transporter [Candidatus Bandiella numerosa]WHA05487.1 MFS transporter [Candidatus Bandiella numerosa]
MSANNSKLTIYQKEAVGILSMGTFLEYFDMMLYVHMAVLLNDLFFPKSNPTATHLLTTFAFCSTYLLRPIGGFIIGKIGDAMGRKATIILTTFLMSAACLVMAKLPTYAEIGIYATLGVMLCRMIQGFSTSGEAMGALIYMNEFLKSPNRYVASGIIDFARRIGSLFALIIASFALFADFNWRLAFWIGAVIAVIGVFARTRLRETPDFADYKRRMKLKEELSESKIYTSSKKVKYDKKAVIAMFFGIAIDSISFYISYIYIGIFMKNSLGMSPADVIKHNLIVAMLSSLSPIILALFSKKYHPIRILKFNLIIVAIIIPFVPYFLENIKNLILIIFLQFIINAFIGSFYAEAMWMKHFPVERRFAIVATTFGVATALGMAVVSFGLPPLSKYMGHYAILVFFIPCIIGFLWSLSYLKELEIKTGRYHNYPNEDFPHEDTAGKEEEYEYEMGDEYKSFINRCEYSEALLNKLEIISKEENRKLNMKLIEKAIIFAKKWHGTQMRKTGDRPFYSHPLKVAEMVAEHYCKTDVIVASILLEDSECTVDIIEKEFNARIAEMVDMLTNKRFENGKHIKLTFEEMLGRLQSVDDIEALLIKQMDREHNLETIEGLKPEKQRKMAEESNNHFIKLLAIIGDKLGIHGKVHLENKMFKYSCGVLKKKNEDV